MDAVLIAARAALAAVFVVAALAKLFDMAGSRRALQEFGVPAAIASPAGIALPVLELTAAALLVIAPTVQAGAALAVILLASFTAALAVAVRRGRAPDCHCFGQLHSEPAGWRTAARSAALALAAAFVLAAGPGPGIPWWLSNAEGTTVALVCVGLLTIALVSAAVSLWHQNRLLTGRGHVSAAPASLKVGQAVPEAGLVREDGTSVSAAGLLYGGRRAVLVFTDANCEPCIDLLPELARLRGVLYGRLDFHVLGAGDEQQNRRLAAEHGIPLLLDRDGAAARAFAVEATPSAIEVDALGRVAAPTASGATAIEGLIRAALERPAQAAGLELHHVEGSVGPRTADAAS